jgi:hypothetical protein
LHGDNNKVEDCEVYDVARYKLYDTTGNAWPAAITIGHSMPGTYGFGSNSAVRRSKAYLSGGEGIMLMNCHTSVAEDNEVWDNRAVQIHLTDCDDSTVQRNLVYGTAASTTKWGGIGRGINLTNEYNNTNPSGSNNNKILNNIVYNVGEALSVWRYFPTSTTNCVVAYNTFVDSRTSGYGSGANMINFWGDGTVSGNVFRNNIIDTVVAGASIFGGSPSGWTFDHNIWRLTPSGITIEGTSTVANPNLTRTGSVAAGAVDTDFFRPLSGSWCYGHAVTISGVTGDLLSATRSVTPTVGALEDNTGSSDYAPTAAPWVTDDVGSVPTSGTDEYSPSLLTYRQVGYGADVWSTADAFCFTYREITGDFTFQYRVASATGGGVYSKAGSDVRVALTAGSRHITINQIQSGLIQRLIRTADGGLTSYTNGSTGNKWQRVVRSGDMITTSHSADGSTWTTLAVDDITGWGTTLYVGRMACANDASASVTVLYDNVALSAYEDAIGTISFGFDLAGVASPTAIREAAGTISFGFDLLGNTASAAIIDAVGTISIDFLLNGVADPNIGDISDTTIFGNYKRALIGTVPQTTYGPVTAGTQSSLLGCAISNRKAAIVKVSVALVNGANTYYRAYNLPIQPNAVLYPFASGLRLDLKPGDKLVVSADQESAVDSVVSYVERPP